MPINSKPSTAKTEKNHFSFAPKNHLKERTRTRVGMERAKF